MAEVIITCGKLCSGKTTCAKKLSRERNGVILSIDEVMLALFPEGAGEKHDLYVRRTEEYLLSLSLQLTRTGTNVILDWGLWTREQRDRIRAFYRAHDTAYRICYLRISSEEWNRRIRKRNAGQKENPSAYYVDEGLLRKFESLFEEPGADETDVTVIDADRGFPEA